jgi:AcrR family transcriptional regulator
VNAPVGAPARPGRHRSAAADVAILEAALALLREEGYRRFTMSAVIERAGVSSATLYRRWPTRQALVAAAVGSMVVIATDCDTGSLRGDLAAFVHARVAAVADDGPFLDALHRELVDDAEVTEAMRERIIGPAVQTVADIVRRAAARGEIASPSVDDDVLLSLVVGPLHHRSVVMRRPIDAAFEAVVVEQAAAGLGGAEPQTVSTRVASSR